MQNHSCLSQCAGDFTRLTDRAGDGEAMVPARFLPGFQAHSTTMHATRGA
jgi:hypothetical protein